MSYGCEEIGSESGGVELLFRRKDERIGRGATTMGEEKKVAILSWTVVILLGTVMSNLPSLLRQ